MQLKLLKNEMSDRMMKRKKVKLRNTDIFWLLFAAMLQTVTGVNSNR